MKQKTIEDTLLKIGVPAGIQGFSYITDAVMLLDTPEWKKGGKFTALYDKVGEMNSTTGQRVERCIRHAFETARKRKGEDEYTLYYIGEDGTANSNSLKMIHMRLKNDGEPKEAETPTSGLDEIALRRIIREEVREFLKDVLLGGDTL